jgi:hypothetical protein
MRTSKFRGLKISPKFESPVPSHMPHVLHSRPCISPSFIFNNFSFILKRNMDSGCRHWISSCEIFTGEDLYLLRFWVKVWYQSHLYDCSNVLIQSSEAPSHGPTVVSKCVSIWCGNNKWVDDGSHAWRDTHLRRDVWIKFYIDWKSWSPTTYIYERTR